MTKTRYVMVIEEDGLGTLRLEEMTMDGTFAKWEPKIKLEANPTETVRITTAIQSVVRSILENRTDLQETPKAQ